MLYICAYFVYFKIKNVHKYWTVCTLHVWKICPRTVLQCTSYYVCIGSYCSSFKGTTQLDRFCHNSISQQDSLKGRGFETFSWIYRFSLIQEALQVPRHLEWPLGHKYLERHIWMRTQARTRTWTQTRTQAWTWIGMLWLHRYPNGPRVPMVLYRLSMTHQNASLNGAINL
jgi:hypothetical protein